MVTFGPISQVGWARASATETSANCWSVRVRNGPPLAVRITRWTSLRRPDCMAWKTALCSLSTGTIWACFSSASRMTSGPATTRLSLLARATDLPASKAAQVPCRPALPTIAESTMSISGSPTARAIPSGPASNSTPSGKVDRSICPAFSRSVMMIQRGWNSAACSWSKSTLLWAERTRAHNSPPELAITSSAFRPMLPVEPRTATFFPGWGMGESGSEMVNTLEAGSAKQGALYEKQPKAATWFAWAVRLWPVSDRAVVVAGL